MKEKKAMKVALNDMNQLNIPTYLLNEYHKRRIREKLIKRGG